MASANATVDVPVDDANEKRQSTEKDISQPGERAEEEEKKISSGAAYFRIFKYSDKLDWTLLVIGTIAAVGSGVALALVNVIFGAFVGIINDFSAGKTSPEEFMDGVVDYAIYFIYLFVARFVLGYIFTVTFSIAGIRLTRTIRYQFLRAILGQEVAFFDREGSSNVSTQVTTNGNMIQQGVSEKAALAIQATASFIAAFVIAIEAQWKLALITITIVPVIVGVTGWMVDADTKIEQAVLEIYAQGAALAEDAIGSIRSVQAFHARPKLVRKFEEYLDKAYKIAQKKSPVYGILFSIEYFCIYAGFALAFFQGVRMFANGEINNPGVIITVLFSVIIAASSLTQVAPHLQSFSNAASAASALFTVMDRTSQISSFDEGGEKPGSEPVEEIQLSHVTFAYPTRKHITVLDDFSLKIPAKKTTALVGASGSGKSTIIGLMERWYDPQGGEITINGRPITSLNTNWLRQKIRLVQQEPVLFMGTVFDNVCYGLAGTEYETAPREEQMRLVVEACKTANADEFISQLPEGYDTAVGERAGLLSGGQKQRIAIARSIISDPEILLLDEATSALDPHSEGVVQQALDKASANRTTIVIAHKLSTIKNADNICVMHMGKIVEQGTHTELLAANGAYARLVGAQDLNKKGDDDDEDTDEEAQAALTRSKSHIPPGEAAKELVESLDFDKAKLLGIFRLVLTVLTERSNLVWVYAISVVACIIGGLTYPAQALLFAELMDVFTLTKSELTERGDFFSLMFFVVALANFFTYFVCGYLANRIGQDITRHYRSRMFDCMLSQDIVFFDREENTSGGLTSSLSSKPQQLLELMSFNLALILICIVNVLSSSILALIIGWKLGLVVVFAGLPPLVGAGYLRIHFDQKINAETGKNFAESAAVAGEAVSAIRTVTSLTIEEAVLRKFSSKVDGVVSKSIPSLIHSTFWFSLSQSMEYLILALGFWFGCKLVSTGEYTMKQFFIVFIGVFFAGQAAGQLFAFSTSISKGVAAGNYILWLERLNPIVAEKPENIDKKPSDDDPDYSLKSLSFAYPTRPEARVIKNINLEIKPGSFVALVGASGCGKSTMIALFLRFYDPISGSINLNKQPIDTLNPRLYRREIALVSQEPTLYQGDLRMNIALGMDTDDPAATVTDEQIMEAARQANIHDFINSLPDRLSTYVGNRGSQLSGGQRQRIAIARALIRQPKILLLDEATSALDTESEKIVQEALGTAAKMGKRITVAVAHRLSTVRDADVICVFGQGRIVEMGSHEKLVAKRGVYWEMCQAQSLDKAAV